tara:strand:+ start:212 stop:373 length:162 start_codon:yes stop_codon:yes gene_type:complete
MPYGKGTYGSQVGRPPKNKKKKKLSSGQRKIASQAGDKMKIEAADFRKLRSKK